MTQTNPLADAYLQSIRRLLDAPPEDRDRLMGRISRAVCAYLEENPEAGAESLAAGQLRRGADGGVRPRPDGGGPEKETAAAVCGNCRADGAAGCISRALVSFGETPS